MTKTVELKIHPKYLVLADADEVRLPEKISPLLLETYKPDEVFLYAISEWSALFDDNRFYERLAFLQQAGDLREGGVDPLVSLNLEWLKGLRKAGNRLADVIKLLDKNHNIPRSYKLLIRSIGHFKDMVWFNEKVTFDPNDLLKLAQAVRNDQPLNFEAASFTSFYDTYQRYLSEIRALTEAESLTLEEHHLLRRRVRTLKHYFWLVARVTGNEPADEVARLLEPVSTEMGKAQNLIVDLEAAGEVDLKKDKTVVQPRHLAIVEHFLNLHK